MRKKISTSSKKTMFYSTLGKIKKCILTVLWTEEKPHKQSIMTACPIDSPEVTTGENDRTSLIPEEPEGRNIPYIFSYRHRKIGSGNTVVSESLLARFAPLI